MLSYEKLARKPKIFRSFTGLDLPEFDFLYPKIQDEHQKAETTFQEKKKDGDRRGPPFSLTLKDRAMMLRMYYRMYTTYGLLGFLFGIDTTNVYRDIRYLEPAVRQCVPIPKKKYAEAKKATILEELQQYFPELRVVIDASEQEIPRPKNSKKRRTHYSGKKKRHTIKNQYAINQLGYMVHRPPHSPAGRIDYSMARKKLPALPEGLQTFVDRGYKGMDRDFPGMNPVLPYKRKKGKGLTPEQKEFNRNHSRIRIVVEHTISKIKKFRIMCQTFRNRLRRYDSISDIMCGLVNFRIRYQDLIVVP